MTNSRVLYLATPVTGEGHYVFAVPSYAISSAEVVKKLGLLDGCVILIRLSRKRPEEEGVRFHTLRGGRERADDVVRSINDLVARRTESPDSADDREVELRVSMNSDVVRHVRRRGNRLYIWSKSLTEQRSEYVAATVEPSDVSYAHYHEVSEIELFVSEDLLWLGHLELKMHRIPWKGVRVSQARV